MRPNGSASYQRGLTLLELLVTMVIFSLVIGVFAQALHQISLVERRSSDIAKQWPRLWQQGFAVDDAYKTHQAVSRKGDFEASGDSRRFEALWVVETGEYAGRSVRAELRLRPERELDPQRAASESWVLTRRWIEDPNLKLTRLELGETVQAKWPFAVRFRYLSATASPSENWPPLRTRAGGRFVEGTPRAIQLLSADGSLAHMWLFRGNTVAQSDQIGAPFGVAP